MDYRRHYQPGGHYFFTVVTASRRPLLIDHVERLRQAFRHVLRARPFVLEAIVVLPDHLHTLWRLPEGDADYSQRWSLLKRKFSAGLPATPANPSQAQRREKGIWQRRFWEHTIRDAEDWRRHLDYIHYNPVKHGYTQAPGDWPHSSFMRFVRKGWYDVDWGNSEPRTVRGLELE